MPSTATITAFYTFSANTKARATQVNTNFSVFRGHVLPIDPNTQTAISNTYDLGSSEYSWRSSYVGGWQLVNETTTGSGALLLKHSGTSRLAVTSSQGATSAAGLGQFAYKEFSDVNISGNFSTAGASGGYLVPGCTITITTVGRPVSIGLAASRSGLAAGFNDGRIYFESSVTANVTCGLKFYIGDTVTAGDLLAAYFAGSGVTQAYGFTLPRHLVYLSAGTHTIYLRLRHSGSGVSLNLNNLAIYAVET